MNRSPSDGTPPYETTRQDEIMTKVKLQIPPDQTPAEEARLVAEVAAAIAERTGDDEIHFELEQPEEVSYQAVMQRSQNTDRWTR